MTSLPWLIGIDFQQVFEPGAPWGAPLFNEAVSGMQKLVPAFVGRTVLTKFVAPQSPAGSWVPYYDRHTFALVEQSHPMWELTPQLLSQVTLEENPPKIETRTTFGKWDKQLHSSVYNAEWLVIAGVSTDCCVLATALAAADAGLHVTVVSDACAASTVENHNRALSVLDGFAPLISVCTVDAVLALCEADEFLKTD